jgi:ribonuclease T2
MRLPIDMPGRRALLQLAAAAALLTPGVVQAQAPSCSVPATLPRPHVEGPTDREPRRVVPIGSYTLALSWSPQYCRAHRDEADDSFQCAGANRFGFTLHGLWPDGEGKVWPQYCEAAAVLPEKVIRGAICATPSPQLIQHEWTKHGTCMKTDPARYFATSTRLYRDYAYPDMMALSRRKLTVTSFKRAFAAANPGLTPAMFRLNLGRGGWLEEVWLCLDTAFKPRRCAATGEGAKASAPVKIWRGGAAPVRGRTYRRSSSRT